MISDYAPVWPSEPVLSLCGGILKYLQCVKSARQLFAGAYRKTGEFIIGCDPHHVECCRRKPEMSSFVTLAAVWTSAMQTLAQSHGEADLVLQ